MDYRTFLMPKSGCTLVECEDAIGINEEFFRFAVADGATEAFDAKSWANRLVTSWVNDDVDNFEKWLEEQGKLQHESWNGLKLSWYAEEKSSMGSFAAFVGLQIEMVKEELLWVAVALGDSCLVHQRGNEILLSFPLSDSNNFTSTPALAPSSSALLEKAIPLITSNANSLKNGDTLWLLSDAVAAWFLNAVGKARFSKFLTLLDDSPDEKLMEFFDNQRETNRIKDDDIAIVRISITKN